MSTFQSTWLNSLCKKKRGGAANGYSTEPQQLLIDRIFFPSLKAIKYSTQSENASKSRHPVTWILELRGL